MADTGRRSFLKLLGLGAVGAVVVGKQEPVPEPVVVPESVEFDLSRATYANWQATTASSNLMITDAEMHKALRSVYEKARVELRGRLTPLSGRLR